MLYPDSNTPSTVFTLRFQAEISRSAKTSNDPKIFEKSCNVFINQRMVDGVKIKQLSTIINKLLCRHFDIFHKYNNR